MDILGLVKLFNAKTVKYVIIGATAFPVHGWARLTLDIDCMKEAAGRVKDLEDLKYLREIQKQKGA